MRGANPKDKQENTHNDQGNPYIILDVAPDASFVEIRKAYLTKVRQFPPEKEPNAFKQIRKAYATLKDAEARKKLDLSIFRQTSGINIDTECEIDFKKLFRGRIIGFLTTASWVYSPDFSEHFHDISEEIRELT